MKRSLRSAVVLTALSMVSAGSVSLWGQEQTLPREVERPADPCKAKIRQAAAIHGAIQVVLDEQRFQDVLVEFQSILDLDLGPGCGKERLVAQSAWQIASRLRETGQFGVAHEVANTALARMRQCENEFPLLMLRAKIFQEQRRYREALSDFRRAKDLESCAGKSAEPR